MRELDEVLAAGLAAREEGIPGAAPAGVLGGIVGQVRRNRARRHALQGVAAAVAVAVLGGVGWWGLGHPAPEPAVTPQPTVTVTTPTPTSSAVPPKPTPTPVSTVAPETVAVQGLPRLPQASPELVTAATPGWVLATYVLTTADWYDSDSPATVRTLLLISPEGERFHLVDLPLDRNVRVERWEAGTSFVDARASDDATGWVWLRIDLITGAITEGGTASPPVETQDPEHDLGWSWDGRRVVAYYEESKYGEHMDSRAAVYLRAFDGTQTLVQEVTWPNAYENVPVLDPSGQRLLFWSPRTPSSLASSIAQDDQQHVQGSLVVDLRSGSVTTRTLEEPDTCEFVNWFADGTGLAVCGTDEDRFQGYGPPLDGRPDSGLTMYRLDVLGSGAPTLLGPRPDLLYAWTGDGTVTPEGLWFMRSDDVHGVTMTPWRVTASGDVRPLDLTVAGDIAYPVVVDYADGTLYAVTVEYEGPDTALRAVAPDGTVIELFPEDLPQTGGLLRRMAFVVGH